MRKKTHGIFFLLLILLFLPLNIFAAHSGSSPFDPPESSDTIFVIDSGSTLDQFLFRSGGPIEFDIEVDRYVGEVDSGGYLADPTEMIQNRIISSTAQLRIPVYDVDYDLSDRPQLIADGVNPERDRIYFNGFNITPIYLEGSNKTWKLNEFTIPIEYVKFPAQGTAPSGFPTPAKNRVTIYIDQANIGNYIPEYGTSEFWAVEVDWAELSFDAMPPVVLIHGNSSNGGFWDRRGFTQVLRDNNIPYDNSINIPTNTVAINGATLNNEIIAVAKRMGVQNIQIVAHSKGGLDTREFLDSYYSVLEKNKELKVHTFITLSTPHRGSVGADYIKAIELAPAFTLVNPNARTRMAEWLTILQGYNEEDYLANENLTTFWTKAIFNRRNRLPSNIQYYSVGADADVDNSGSLERNEYQEMLDEAEWPDLWDIIANKPVNIMYQALGNFSSAKVRQIGNIGFPFYTPIYELVETPTVSFQENDMMVTVNSARFTFNFIGQFAENHASVADEDVAYSVMLYFKYAQ